VLILRASNVQKVAITKDELQLDIAVVGINDVTVLFYGNVSLKIIQEKLWD
jgi:hypothetical protein